MVSTESTPVPPVVAGRQWGEISGTAAQTWYMHNDWNGNTRAYTKVSDESLQATSPLFMRKEKHSTMRSTVSATTNASSSLRWLWYAPIGVTLVIAIVAWAYVSPRKLGHGYDNWVQLTILTTVLFVSYLSKLGWKYRSRARFWKLYIILFMAHCVVFVPLFSEGRLPIPLLAVLGSIEVIAIATVLAWALGEKSDSTCGLSRIAGIPSCCRRFCSCESTRLQQRSTDFNKQHVRGSTAITWNQQNSTDFNKL